jgi:hypothetical protein
MAKANGPRVDSAHVQTAIAEAAAKQIAPPKPLKLTKREKPYWDVIVAARFEWTDADLIMAYNLAILHADIQDLNSIIRVGSDDYKDNVKLRDTMIAKSMSLATKIQVHAAATVGEVENTRKKNAAKQKMVRAMQEQDDDDSLIARPH